MAGESHYFMVRCTGNCGGSWLASAISAHPQARAWEELLSEMGLKGGQEILTEESKREICRQACDYFVEQAQSGQWQSVGIIKELLQEIQAHLQDRDPRIMLLVRNPIKVVGYKMGSKTLWLENRLGRPFHDEREMFEAHVSIYAGHFQQLIDRQVDEPLIRLEDLSASLVTPEANYFRRVMEWLTRLEWTDKEVGLVRQNAKPRKREHIPDPDCWQADEYIERHYESPFPIGSARHHYRWPSRGANAWAQWEGWQRAAFLERFERIMVTLGYGWDNG